MVSRRTFVGSVVGTGVVVGVGGVLGTRSVLSSSSPTTPSPKSEKIGVTELGEGNVRKVYIDAPLVGAKGYIVGDWENGQVRVEAKNFPPSEMGYEVFLFEIDIDAFWQAFFVNGDPKMGVVANPPPFDQAVALISQWQSIGDLQREEGGEMLLEYKGGENLYAKGLNMVFIFEKVTSGQHAGPEDPSKLMIECIGPLEGTKGTEGRKRIVKVF